MITAELHKRADLSERVDEIWDELVDQVDPRIGAAGLETLCVQVHRMRDAQRRIDREGLIVRDEKGNPTAHPALEVERRAQQEVRRWLASYGRQKGAFNP